jgi:hypothetical protein
MLNARSLVLLLLLLVLPDRARCGGKKVKDDHLIPPTDSTLQSRKEDIHLCVSQAKADVAFGKPPLDAKAREPLGDHATKAFVRDSLPVVDREYRPAASKSLFAGSGLYGPANLSDRYVLCLLGRGYKWPDDVGEQQKSVESKP